MFRDFVTAIWTIISLQLPHLKWCEGHNLGQGISGLIRSQAHCSCLPAVETATAALGNALVIAAVL
jgi:hypothetical protein